MLNQVIKHFLILFRITTIYIKFNTYFIAVSYIPAKQKSRLSCPKAEPILLLLRLDRFPFFVFLFITLYNTGEKFKIFI